MSATGAGTKAIQREVLTPEAMEFGSLYRCSNPEEAVHAQGS